MSALEFLTDHLIGIFFIFATYFVYTRMIERSVHHRRGRRALKKSTELNIAEPLTLHPEVDAALCVGCGACTRVCPEGDILKMINHKAQLVSPTKCVGHGECEKSCPLGAITLAFGTKTKGMEIPRLTVNYESNVPGLYIAGEMGGMGLIRNAVKQGSWAARHAIHNLGPSVAKGYDLAIVGAGPAGIAAALEAIDHKKSYIILEQSKFGGSVANYPRQKIVMSQAFELPILGKAQFPNNRISKEQLLEFVLKLKRDFKLNVSEKTRFESLEKLNNGDFDIRTTSGNFRAKKVLLSMGVRGSPRRLDIPGEDLAKVTYSLEDAAQYSDSELVVVGGGNAAAEAAIQLSAQELNNHVTLLIRGKSFDTANASNQSIIHGLAKAGRLSLKFNATLERIGTESVEIRELNEIPKPITNDFVFIFAGAAMPVKLMMSLGIQLEKKYGETRSNRMSKSARSPKSDNVAVEGRV